jgi:carbamoylphosphate synthase large subunit
MNPVKLAIIHLDKKNRTALVRSSKNRSFPVKMQMEDWKVECVQRGDDAIVTKSAVTGEWLMIDYSFSNAFNYAVHNSMQEDYEDMICDERGVPYEF